MSEDVDGYAYNYTGRMAKIESSEFESPIESSCYTETDCNAPGGPNGEELWCLVTREFNHPSQLFDLVSAHVPCGTTLDLLDAFAIHSTAPTCFRVGFGSYAGAVYEGLGELAERFKSDRVPASIVEQIQRLATVAADAYDGTPNPEHKAKSASALRQLRAAVAPYRHARSIWEVDFLAERALASLEGRYPYTYVAPNNTFFDAMPTEALPDRIRPTEPDWRDHAR